MTEQYTVRHEGRATWQGTVSGLLAERAQLRGALRDAAAALHDVTRPSMLTGPSSEIIHRICTDAEARCRDALAVTP